MGPWKKGIGTRPSPLIKFAGFSKVPYGSLEHRTKSLDRILRIEAFNCLLVAEGGLEPSTYRV